MTTVTRRALSALTALALVFGGGATAVAAPAPTVPTLTGIRTGLHPGYDRIVLDLRGGPAPKVTSKWVRHLVADGSGAPVSLSGRHFLAVVATPAAAHDDSGTSTYRGATKFRTRNLRNVMAVAVTGDFEGYLSIGVGTRHRTWVRTFTLGSPTRVVIDVGHRPR